VSAIFEQLELNQTFFIQLALFAVLFLLLKPLYFKPFLKLFEARHKSTVADQEAAEKLMADAQAKLDEYKRRLSEERAAARKEFDALIDQAKKEEAAFLQHAREEAKKITQQAAESATQQHDELKRKLDIEVESLAHSISEKLLLRKV
jgi:F0F1-type ATP synthase membrane subunit b/b'